MQTNKKDILILQAYDLINIMADIIPLSKLSKDLVDAKIGWTSDLFDMLRANEIETPYKEGLDEN